MAGEALHRGDDKLRHATVSRDGYAARAPLSENCMRIALTLAYLLAPVALAAQAPVVLYETRRP